jgi:hypothetical protein
LIQDGAPQLSSRISSGDGRFQFDFRVGQLAQPNTQIDIQGEYHDNLHGSANILLSMLASFDMYALNARMPPQSLMHISQTSSTGSLVRSWANPSSTTSSPPQMLPCLEMLLLGQLQQWATS